MPLYWRNLYFEFVFFIILPAKQQPSGRHGINDDNILFPDISSVNGLQVYAVSEVPVQMMSYYTWFMWMCERVRRYILCRTKIQTCAQVLRKKLNKITHSAVSGICHNRRGRRKRKHIIRRRRGTAMRNDTIIFHQYPSPKL